MKTDIFHTIQGITVYNLKEMATWNQIRTIGMLYTWNIITIPASRISEYYHRWNCLQEGGRYPT